MKLQQALRAWDAAPHLKRSLLTFGSIKKLPPHLSSNLVSQYALKHEPAFLFFSVLAAREAGARALLQRHAELPRHSAAGLDATGTQWHELAFLSFPFAAPSPGGKRGLAPIRAGR